MRPDAKRLAVLASGGGSNLQAILDHLASLGASAPATVTLVGSDRAAAGALDRASARGIDAVELKEARDPENRELLPLLQRHRIDLVALAGYLRMIPPEVVDAYDGRIANVHPALLPAFGGPGMYGRRVHQAVLDAGVRVSGVTVHRVTREYDRGPVLAQWPVPVQPGDTASTLAARVLEAEHVLYPRVIVALATGRTAAFPARPQEAVFLNPPVPGTDLAKHIDALLQLG